MRRLCTADDLFAFAIARLRVGASVPVMLTSRSDTAMSRLAFCAVAALHQARTGKAG